jgi:hypothetical protein
VSTRDFGMIERPRELLKESQFLAEWAGEEHREQRVLTSSKEHQTKIRFLRWKVISIAAFMASSDRKEK